MSELEGFGHTRHAPRASVADSVRHLPNSSPAGQTRARLLPAEPTCVTCHRFAHTGTKPVSRPGVSENAVLPTSGWSPGREELCRGAPEARAQVPGCPRACHPSWQTWWLLRLLCTRQPQPSAHRHSAPGWSLSSMEVRDSAPGSPRARGNSLHGFLMPLSVGRALSLKLPGPHSLAGMCARRGVLWWGPEQGTLLR